ncbi:putative O-glycosylation ligase, exosortase A system-associated [Erythrobacter sp. YT30]|uniref:putative O-glycosylation ligase, exosortase A system-associated n=1 Tax=Erythrobacter sp. YT30 TaxID=1735012 RepID=UPI00076D2804|nr:putative O-glycosylation ligase, exosortase A system-associated [Erythrobacter sp. YT30]KWV91547.1 polymerase [Erythrobacter sp. YT30]
MTEVFLLGFFVILLLAGLKHPFVWVLLYLYIEIVSPSKVGTQILASIQMSLITFGAMVGGWLLFDKTKGKARFGMRQGLIVALLLYCLVTTGSADFPDSAAEKWDWVWKSLIFAAFLPLTLTSRLRIEGAIMFYVLSLSVIVINGGVKTFLGGGGYGRLRLLVDDNSGLYESSIIACAAITAIPLIWWVATHGRVFPRDWKTKAFAAGYTFAAILIPIGTSARTGLVCLAVFGLLLLVQMKRRVLYGALMAVAMVASIPFLPASFTERMATIQNYQADQSASSRLAVWEWTIDYAMENPFGGGFTAYRANSIEIDLVEENRGANASLVTEKTVVDKARAYHSSYFEMLGEQGWPGLGLFLLLHGLGLWHLRKLYKGWKNRTSERDRWVSPLALALQQSHIIYLVGAVFVGIAFQPFIMLIIAFQAALWSYSKILEGEASIDDSRPLRMREKASAATA